MALKVSGLCYSKLCEVILSFFSERGEHIVAEQLYLELKRCGELSPIQASRRSPRANE